MLCWVRLHNFKLHSDLSLDFDAINFIYWPNGSWKTNILESIYLLVNSISYKSTPFSRIKSHLKDEMLLECDVWEDYLLRKLKIWYEHTTQKVNFISWWVKITKPKYISDSGHIWVFFEPLEMNVMYLWPSLRREFLDEMLLLGDDTFLKIKSNYQKALKNRNAILKNIALQKAWISDIAYWDAVFAKTASAYFSKRMEMVSFIRSRISLIEELLEWKYELSFDYITKISETSPEESILEYITKNFQRDVILGHTYIWPHLDDFTISVSDWKWGSVSSQDFLSRWENKTILIWLKFIELEYFKSKKGSDIILLLDDIFSELDEKHTKLVLDLSKHYQTFITAQTLPSFIECDTNIKKILLN